MAVMRGFWDGKGEMQSLVPQASAAPAKLAASPLDEGVLRLWLANRSANTKAAYERDVRAFLAWCGRPLAQVTLAGWNNFRSMVSGFEIQRREGGQPMDAHSGEPTGSAVAGD